MKIKQCRKGSYALTFDDGPGPSTSDLLNVLSKWKTKATFFVLGRNIKNPTWTSTKGARKLLVRMLDLGHQLGNHTISHQPFPRSMEAFIDEILQCDELIRENLSHG